MGFFADHDELYWNVTGNGWDFEIDRATALYEISLRYYVLGLRAAGASDGAQLDINWNWTRFFTFARGPDGKLGVAKTLVEVEHTRRDYVETASKRDFFYVVRRN